jgi:hypothetical protein
MDFVLNRMVNELFPCSAIRPDDMPLYLPDQSELMTSCSFSTYNCPGCSFCYFLKMEAVSSSEIKEACFNKVLHHIVFQQQKGSGLMIQVTRTLFLLSARCRLPVSMLPLLGQLVPSQASPWQPSTMPYAMLQMVSLESSTCLVSRTLKWVCMVQF